MYNVQHQLPVGIFTPREIFDYSPTDINKRTQEWEFILGNAEMECLAGLLLDLGLHFLQWVGVDLFKLSSLKETFADEYHRTAIQFLTTGHFDVLDIARILQQRELLTIQEEDTTFLVFPTEELVHAAFLSTK